MRQHYSQLRVGAREGLPTDLAYPLSVGQQVIAIHPKTREAHDGKVLTVDHDRCRVQFDSPELGVEFVMVIVLFSILAFQCIHLMFILEITQTYYFRILIACH